MPNRKRKPGNAGKSSAYPQHVLVKALSHPIRAQALTILTYRVASAKEIAEETGAKLSTVSYHGRVLHELRLIELRRKQYIRGSVARFYKAVQRSIGENAQWAELDSKVRSTTSAQLINALVTDAAEALKAGVFDRRQDRHLSQTALFIDEPGWRAINALLARTHDMILKEQNAAKARMGNGAKIGFPAVAFALCFEIAPHSDPDRLG